MTEEDNKNSKNFEKEAKPEDLPAGDVSGKEEQTETGKQEIPLADAQAGRNTESPGTPETMVEETKETKTELREETQTELRLEEKQDGTIEKEEEPSTQKSTTTGPENTTTGDTEKKEDKTLEKPEKKKAEEPGEEKAEEPEKKTLEKPAEKKAEEPEKKTLEKPAEEKAEEPEKKTPEKPAEEKAEEPKKKTLEKPAEEKAEEPEKRERKTEKTARKTKTSTKESEKEKSKEQAPKPSTLEKIASEETVAVDKFQKYQKNLETKLFGKYDFSEVVVTDMGLARYINLDPIYIPHSGGKHAKRIFEKAKVNIIERFINKLMRTQHYTGKKHTTYQLLRESFHKIEKRTKTNPIQVLIEAIENAAPMEEATRLRFGGISVPKAVDISPSRRLDIALRNIAIGATMARKSRNKHMSDCLADEIIKAAKRDMSCFSIQKKEEKQRYAGSAR